MREMLTHHRVSLSFLYQSFVLYVNLSLVYQPLLLCQPIFFAFSSIDFLH